MEIVNPTFGLRAATGAVASRPRGLDGWSPETLCLFSNSKPNATALLTGIGSRLAERWGPAEIATLTKPAASVPAEPELISRVARCYSAVILALGD